MMDLYFAIKTFFFGGMLTDLFVCYGKNTHGRAMSDAVKFRAEYGVQPVLVSHHHMPDSIKDIVGAGYTPDRIIVAAYRNGGIFTHRTMKIFVLEVENED